MRRRTSALSWLGVASKPAGDVYQLMRVAYPGAFLLMIVEGAVRGGPSAVGSSCGLVLFLAAKALKWSAILALGRSWTFRVITVPRGPLVTTGPYRLFRHPNYVGVIGELAGVALMSGALVAGPAGDSRVRRADPQAHRGRGACASGVGLFLISTLTPTPYSLSLIPNPSHDPYVIMP